MSRPCSIAQWYAGLLVAAVAEVLGLADHGERQVALLLVAQPDQVRGVGAGVVGHQDALDAGDEVAGDSVEHLRQGRGCVVRDDQDAEPLHRIDEVTGAVSAGGGVPGGPVTGDAIRRRARARDRCARNHSYDSTTIGALECRGLPAELGPRPRRVEPQRLAVEEPVVRRERRQPELGERGACRRAPVRPAATAPRSRCRRGRRAPAASRASCRTRSRRCCRRPGPARRRRAGTRRRGRRRARTGSGCRREPSTNTGAPSATNSNSTAMMPSRPWPRIVRGPHDRDVEAGRDRVVAEQLGLELRPAVRLERLRRASLRSPGCDSGMPKIALDDVCTTLPTPGVARREEHVRGAAPRSPTGTAPCPCASGTWATLLKHDVDALARLAQTRRGRGRRPRRTRTSPRRAGGLRSKIADVVAARQRQVGEHARRSSRSRR